MKRAQMKQTTNAQKQNTIETKQKSMVGKSIYSTRAKALKSEETNNLIQKDTDYRRICFIEEIVFLKMSKSLHKWLAAEAHLSYGELLQVAVNREEFLK